MEKLKKPVKVETNKANESLNNSCELCSKAFSTKNKLNEHLNSKSHKHKLGLSQLKENTEKLNTNNNESNANTEKKKILTAENNYLICFACNAEGSKDLKDLFNHLKSSHEFEFPVNSCLIKPEKAVKLCIKKIFKYGACLYCDSQRFPNAKAVQSHMRDKAHCKINFEDILEHFYKFYDKKKLNEVSESDKKTKEFKLLRKILLPKNTKEKSNTIKEEENDDYESEIEEVEEINENDVVKDEKVDEIKDKEETVNTKIDNNNNKTKKAETKESEEVSEDDEDLKEVNYVKMDNGEILLRDGTVVGNKIYKTYYKQRVKLSSQISKTNSQHLAILRLKAKSHQREINKFLNKKDAYSHWRLTGSKKSNFTRVNTLHKVRKQVNC